MSVGGTLHQSGGEELVSALLFQPGLTECLVHARELQSPGVATATQPAAYKESSPGSYEFVLPRRPVFRESTQIITYVTSAHSIRDGHGHWAYDIKKKGRKGYSAKFRLKTRWNKMCQDPFIFFVSFIYISTVSGVGACMSQQCGAVIGQLVGGDSLLPGIKLGLSDLASGAFTHQDILPAPNS